MTECLIAASAAIILWTNLVVMPAENLFDAIEVQSECRTVELRRILCEPIRCKILRNDIAIPTKPWPTRSFIFS